MAKRSLRTQGQDWYREEMTDEEFIRAAWANAYQQARSNVGNRVYGMGLSDIKKQVQAGGARVYRAFTLLIEFILILVFLFFLSIAIVGIQGVYRVIGIRGVTVLTVGALIASVAYWLYKAHTNRIHRKS